MVFHGSRMVFMVPDQFFMVPGQFSWFFMVPGWFFMVSGWFLMVPGQFSWFYMFQVGFLWFQVGFSWSQVSFSWFQAGFSWFMVSYLCPDLPHWRPSLVGGPRPRRAQKNKSFTGAPPPLMLKVIQYQCILILLPYRPCVHAAINCVHGPLAPQGGLKSQKFQLQTPL